MRIITGPTVQLGLDLQYPTLSNHQLERQLVGPGFRRIRSAWSRVLVFDLG